MFTCPADNRVSLVDVCLELECLLARLTTVCPYVLFELECLLARLKTVCP